MRALAGMVRQWLGVDSSGTRENGTPAGPGRRDPVFDSTWLLEILGGDMDTALRIIRIFIDTAPQDLARCRDAVAAGDLAGAQLASHSLKSQAATLGDEDMRIAALGVELACREGAAARAGDSLPRLSRRLELLLGRLRRFLADSRSDTSAPSGITDEVRAAELTSEPS
jgi:HPt (histidine-containing phosphotransfer) domain-containing protein